MAFHCLFVLVRSCIWTELPHPETDATRPALVRLTSRDRPFAVSSKRACGRDINLRCRLSAIVSEPLRFLIQLRLHPQSQRRLKMKRFVLAVALTGLISVPVLAGNIPTNGVVETPPPPTTTAQSATSSTLLTNVVLTIITTLIGR